MVAAAREVEEEGEQVAGGRRTVRRLRARRSLSLLRLFTRPSRLRLLRRAAHVSYGCTYGHITTYASPRQLSYAAFVTLCRRLPLTLLRTHACRRYWRPVTAFTTLPVILYAAAREIQTVDR